MQLQINPNLFRPRRDRLPLLQYRYRYFYFIIDEYFGVNYLQHTNIKMTKNTKIKKVVAKKPSVPKHSNTILFFGVDKFRPLVIHKLIVSTPHPAFIGCKHSSGSIVLCQYGVLIKTGSQATLSVGLSI